MTFIQKLTHLRTVQDWIVRPQMKTVPGVAGADAIGGFVKQFQLRGDVARMNRLIDQLLRVARLDGMPMSIDASVDLTAVAAKTVKYLAPWAIDQDRAISFDAPNSRVLVRGNADAIADVLRDLVENTVYHTPPRTEITVAVSMNGTVEIADRGRVSPRKIASASSSDFGASHRSKRLAPGWGLRSWRRSFAPMEAPLRVEMPRAVAPNFQCICSLHNSLA